MKEFKGTPGPWVTDKTSRAIGPVSKDDDQSYGMVIPIAWVEFDPEIEIQVANANIIGAATELFSAVNLILELQLRGFITLGDKHTGTLRAAIAKALGE